MKTGFTEQEERLIEIICSLYAIQIRSYKYGVFIGMISPEVRISLNGTYMIQLLQTGNPVYLEVVSGMNVLTIIHQ